MSAKRYTEEFRIEAVKQVASIDILLIADDFTLTVGELWFNGVGEMEGVPSCLKATHKWVELGRILWKCL
jgi:hypothetical protein